MMLMEEINSTMETRRLPGIKVVLEESNAIFLAKCYQNLFLNYKEFMIGTLYIIEQVAIVIGHRSFMVEDIYNIGFGVTNVIKMSILLGMK